MGTRWIWLAISLPGSIAAASPLQAAGPANPQLHVCVLDLAAIVQQSRLAQNMGTRFQQVRQQAQAKLEDDRRTLDADARALDGLRASIPPAIAKSRDAQIAQRRLQLKARADQINHNLAALDDQLTANITKASDPVVRAVEAERGCSLLLGSNMILHLDDSSLDITPMVLDRMNAASSQLPVGR